MADARTTSEPHAPRRWSRRKWVAAIAVGASIVAFVTTPLGAAVMYVSTQLADEAPAFALPPPATGYSHGAAGSALNGFGGSIAPSATIPSWPGTGAGGNGGPFAFVGAHHGSLWGVPAGDNNSRGVGYCVMEDVGGSGTVTLRPDPPQWDAGEMARAGALMSTFGGDRVVPYGINDGGNYDVATGEWEHPFLLGGGEYTRRRQVAVNFGARMFLEDLSPSGVAAGRKLARDTSIVNGSGGDFAALRWGYTVAQYMADVAEAQSAIGGILLTMVWGTPNGLPPTSPGTYPLEVIVTDSTGRRVGLVPVLQLSGVGIGSNRSVAATAAVDNSGDSSDDMARWNAASATGWPVWGMVGLLATDARFVVGTGSGPGAGGPTSSAADVADRSGVARFDVTITSAEWQLAFHAQAPTNDVALYAGTGVQGQVTWVGPPQSASVHAQFVPPEVGRFAIRKVLDDAGVQGTRDMSGFTFEVSRISTTPGTDPVQPLGSFTTDAAGRTPPIVAVIGEFRVAEVGRPAWAAGLIDTGPIPFRLVAGTRGDPNGIAVVEFTYTNVVPAATLATRAFDRVDGDQFVQLPPLGPSDAAGTVGTEPAAEVADAVTYCGLVPGTTYTVAGSIQVVTAGTATASGGTGATTFTPTEPCGTVEVVFAIPPDTALRGRTGVVFEILTLASTGQIVAQHADPSSASQTLYFPSVTTAMRSTGSGPTDDDRVIAPGDEVVDIVTMSGLAPGRIHRAVLTLFERLDDGTCVATDMTATRDFTGSVAAGDPAATPAPQEVIVGGIAVPEPGVFVGFERIYLIERTEEAERLTLVAAHEDCDEPSQTVRSIAPPPPPPPAPPSSPAPTTETTVPEPSASTTSTPAAETSSTNPPATSVVPGRPLPRTGSSTRGLATTAALLATCGIGAIAISRRRW